LVQTARQHWRLLAISGSLNLLEALSEGVTLAVMFAAIGLLGTAATPGWLAWLGWQPLALFLALMALAVLLQGLQSLMRYGNAVAVGLFAARCRARITRALHRQILRFSFACASRYRVGDLVSHATLGPEAVEKQITTSAQLVVHGLMAIAYLAVLVVLSPWLLLGALLMGALLAAVQRQVLPRLRHRAHQLSAAMVAGDGSCPGSLQFCCSCRCNQPWRWCPAIATASVRVMRWRCAFWIRGRPNWQGR